MIEIKIGDFTFSVSGKSISLKNNSLCVDGKTIQSNINQDVHIYLNGDAVSIDAQGSVSVHGNVLGNVDCGGSVKCADVGGKVDCGGSVTCKSVRGNIDAGGSVRCEFKNS